MHASSALIYARFSTAEQRKGSSRSRQLYDCRSYCEKNNLTVEREIVDEGFSAWAGKHRERGGFGELEREILDGLHRGKVLVVEHLDRLSRLDPETTLSLVQSIVRSGVTIVTVDGAQTYERDSRLPVLTILTLLIGSEQNHKQSEDKSRRLRAAYDRRRQQARESGRALTALAPAWLKLGKDRKWIVREDRAALVREIYQWADDGAGKLTIARRLNERGEPVWSDAKGWHPSFISRILANAAVIGEFQPRERNAGSVGDIGEPITDYYPKVVDADLFARVRGNAGSRKAVRGRRSTKMANLISGLARCSSCGSTMAFRVRVAAGGTRIIKGKLYPRHSHDSVLRCASNLRKAGCENSTSIAYTSFERTLLDQVLHLALDDRAFASDGDVRRLRIDIAESERLLARSKESAEGLWKAWSLNQSPMRMTLAERAEEDATAIEEKLGILRQDMTRARGRVSHDAHLARVADVRANLNSEDADLNAAARAKVAEALRSAIREIRCRPDRRVDVSMKGGMRLISIHTGRGHHKVSVLDMVHPDRNYADEAPLESAVRRRIKAHQ